MNIQTGRCHGNLGSAIFRISMGGSAILNWYNSLFENRSMMYQAGLYPDRAELITLMMLLGVVMILEVCINDFLPRRLQWEWLLKQRHLLLLAMAFCAMAQLYIAYTENHPVGLALYYTWNAGSLIAYAFADSIQRSKDTKCVIACN